MIKPSVKKKLEKIKLFVSDFDGTMTDGFVYVDERGRETVRVSRKDGLGVEMLKQAGIKVFVLSKEKNSVVRARCRKLGVIFWQGVPDSKGKESLLKQLTKKYKCSPEEVLYIGDDINDISALKYAGVKVTVQDASPLVKKIADIITKAKGGDHAIREIADAVLEARLT